MTIHQVTFLYQDCEIAYGEGESVEWAFEEANDQFKNSPYNIMDEDVSVVWCSSMMKTTTTATSARKCLIGTR